MTTLTTEQIDRLFANATHQADIFIELYKLVTPDFDKVAKLLDFPKCSNTTYDYIMCEFIDFDRSHHPDILSGGLWMNSGFSIDNTVPDWEVLPATKVIYKES